MSTRKSYHHGNLRQALVEATIELITARGPQGFTLAEAARQAGVSAAAPYRHFKGRDELISEVSRQGYILFGDLLEHAYDGGKPTALAAFSKVGRAYLAFAKRYPGYYIAMFESGVSLTGSAELALASDLRVASETATLGLTETSLAIIPGAGGTQRLPRIVGKAKAKELIFLARRVPADECLAIGLANRVVPLDDLLAEARGLASQITRNGPVALKAAKRAIDRGMEMDLASALVFAGTGYEMTIPTEDRIEGLTAFRGKRKPVYRGR